MDYSVIQDTIIKLNDIWNWLITPVTEGNRFYDVMNLIGLANKPPIIFFLGASLLTMILIGGVRKIIGV